MEATHLLAQFYIPGGLGEMCHVIIDKT